MKPLTFKYRSLNEKGQECGFLARRGELTENELVLDKVPIPLSSIFKIYRRQNRLGLAYATDQGVTNFAIAVYGGQARAIKEEVDRLCSYRWAAAHREELAARGQDHHFYTRKCGQCAALVDLTGFPETPQFFCPFCETLLSAKEPAPEQKIKYGLCDQCHFFGRPSKFTTFYFIFLCAAYYYQSRTITCCHACMRKEVWKMFFMNLPFLLGVPSAVSALIRAYAAGSMDPLYPELDNANHAIQKGDLKTAEKYYNEMLERAPAAAGLRYNLALACSQNDQWENCLDYARDALADCSNYQPAANLVFQALTELGRPKEAETFNQAWGRIPEDKGSPKTSEQFKERNPGGDRFTLE
jgi:hypothetical protein